MADFCDALDEFDGTTLALEPDQVARFAPLAHAAGWAGCAATLSDAQIVTLIKAFTLAEESYAAWVCGEKSPVIPLVKELKGRGSYDPELTRWIRANSKNRFLPHGNLMDRL
jgi:hypothetical protein